MTYEIAGLTAAKHAQFFGPEWYEDEPDDALKAAEEFAQEPVRPAGFDRGTQYANGAFDTTYYFDTESGARVTVRYYAVSNEYRADWGN